MVIKILKYLSFTVMNFRSLSLKSIKVSDD